MLALQEYLRSGKTTEDLTAELGVMVYFHPELPLVGFKYNQIESPKFHPIIAECRGIVLERETWNLVAKGFNRFFRPEQNPEIAEKFNWNDFIAYEKVDGSLILVSNYNGKWLVNTSGSFGLGLVGESGLSWTELFWKTCGFSPEQLPWDDYTYVFELCTKWNQVVRLYERDKVFLLSMFDEELEVDKNFVDNIAACLNVDRPEELNLKSRQDVLKLLKRKCVEDPTWEGVVANDGNLKLKFKSESYDALHRLKGDNGFTSPKIINLILNSDIEKVFKGFPQYREEIIRISDWMQKEFNSLHEVWKDAQNIESQKDFALFVLARTKFAGVLFNMRKAGVSGLVDLSMKFREAENQIIKVYQNGNF